MSKILKVIDNETIEIKEYVCPEAVFKSVENPPTLTDIKNEIINFEDYCVFKEIIKPFEMYKELDKYKNIVDELEKFLQEDVVYTSNTKADFISGILEANRLALNKLKELKGEQ